MAMKPQDTILGPARGTFQQAWDFARQHATERVVQAGSYIQEVYRLAPLVGMDPAILVSQSAHETDNWTSPPWVDWLNPAGLGITSKGHDPGYRWDNGTDSARAQIVHMVAYVYGDTVFSSPLSMPSPISNYTRLDPRMKAVFDANLDGTVRTIADLTGKWATDTRYHLKVAAKGNAIFPGIPNQGGTDVALPVPHFEHRIAPRGIPNRTGLPMASPSKITIHEVGNRTAGADAEMHVKFVHNGGGENNVSFHFIVGYDKVCQLIELDEACWHAGDGYNGPGNRDTIAIETIQIGDFDKTLWHLAWLCAEIITNPARFVWENGPPRPYDIDENDHVQHAFWMVKNCPQFIRDRGLWPVLMNRIDQYLALFRNDTGTPTPPPKPKYAERSVPDWLTEEAINSGSNRRLNKTEVFYLGRKWEALRDTPRYRSAIRTSPEIGPPIRKGEHFLAHFILHSHGEWWVLSDLGTRVLMADLDRPSWLDLEELR